jgi:methanogenic corrinoid protein MtbC1
MSRDRIEAMLHDCADSSAGPDPQIFSRRWVEEFLREARAFDENTIRTMIIADAATLGVGRFLRERAIPLIEEIGDAWASGEIGVRHEHFVSGVLERQRDIMRRAFDASTTGRPVVLAGLPEEMHGLGLMMVALEVASSGRRNLVLGPHTPVEEIVAAVESLDAAAVGISVSAYAPPVQTLQEIVALRSALPKRVPLWIGGRGTDSLKDLPGSVKRLNSLDEVSEAVRALSF